MTLTRDEIEKIKFRASHGVLGFGIGESEFTLVERLCDTILSLLPAEGRPELPEGESKITWRKSATDLATDVAHVLMTDPSHQGSKQDIKDFMDQFKARTHTYPQKGTG